MLLTALAPFGESASVIWVFAAGILSVLLTAALVIMAIDLIKTLLK